jgi:hypothetical protein
MTSVFEPQQEAGRHGVAALAEVLLAPKASYNQRVFKGEIGSPTKSHKFEKEKCSK